MDSEVAISVKNLSKTFRIPHEKVSSVRGAVVNMFRDKTYEEFQALDDVSFEVKKGEFFGIIGGNSSSESEENIKNRVVYVAKDSSKKGFFCVLTSYDFFAIVQVLKPPVLTLWAWRGFILSK